jgi:hypothetical protein
LKRESVTTGGKEKGEIGKITGMVTDAHAPTMESLGEKVWSI